MDERGFIEILRHTEQRAQEAGLPTFVEAVGDLPRMPTRPQMLLLDYLRAIDRELALRSRPTPERVLYRLRDVAGDSARDLDGLGVILDDARMADPDRIDLLALPDLESLRGELQSLIGALADEAGSWD